jgi:dihydroxyacetone kinase-like protein
MTITPARLPEFIAAITASLDERADELTALDQAIGDGDHLVNLQRGLAALAAKTGEFASLDWPGAWRLLGMTLMSSVGGASGSLYGTLFMTMAKQACVEPGLAYLADAFAAGVEAMKQRGKSDVGEKTMLDVWVPVANQLRQAASDRAPLVELLASLNQTAAAGAESTRDMLPGKGRASFLGERALGHVDAGARTAEVMIAAIGQELLKRSPNGAI